MMLFQTFAETIWRQLVDTFLISMLPVIELRSGLPYGIALGLDYPEALAAAILGNMVPVPFIIHYIRHIFHWLKKRSPWWQKKLRPLRRKRISRADWSTSTVPSAYVSW